MLFIRGGARMAPAIPCRAEGALYGRGLFETISVAGGMAILLREHLFRMKRSARILGIQFPGDVVRLAVRIQKIISGEIRSLEGVRVTLWAGRPGTRSVLAVMERHSPVGLRDRRNGVRMAIAPWRRSMDDPMARHKTINYLGNLLARREAVRRGCWDALFLTPKGRVAEGAVSNVFSVIQGRVVTPPLSENILPGITRAWVLRRCRFLGIPCVEKPLELRKFRAAGEVFATNALVGILPVVALDGGCIGGGRPGEVTRRLMADYEQFTTGRMI
ncbi:MAG: aminotransferase class IV [Planctomycetota bacterium]